MERCHLKEAGGVLLSSQGLIKELQVMSRNRHALALFEGTVDSRHPLIKHFEPPPPPKTVHCEHLPSPGSAVWAHRSIGQASTSHTPSVPKMQESGLAMWKKGHALGGEKEQKLPMISALSTLCNFLPINIGYTLGMGRSFSFKLEKMTIP